MQMKLRMYLLLSVILVTGCKNETVSEIDLSGQWHYKLDPENVGEVQNWAELKFKNTLRLPGTLEDNNIGDSLVHEPKMDQATLSALHRKHSYIGSAWYQREVIIPDDWEGKYIELKLERVLWESTVWVDGEEVDVQESLVAPHRFDLSDFLSPGTHLLSIRIDNRNKYPNINVYSETYPDEDMQSLAHAYSNHTQVKWNGILGDLVLNASNSARINNVQVYPNLKKSNIILRGRAVTTPNFSGSLIYKITDPAGREVVSSNNQAFQGVVDGENENFEFTIPITNPQYWDEFNPNLYTVVVSLIDSEGVLDQKKVRFGFSQVSREGGVLKLNEKRIFLRGNLECSIFPLTGYPPTEKEEWAELIAKAKDYGLNHLRFHSYNPPKAAFEAADEAGFYLQTELPLWNLEVGQHQGANEFLIAEKKRLLEEYGNHPSFILFSLGNELEGDAEWMNQQVKELKEKDPRRLYTATTFSFQKGFGESVRPHDDFLVTQWTEDGWVRGQEIFNTDRPNFNKDYSRNIVNVEVPIISHEIGQYTVFPDFGEIKKYTGNLAPLNLIAIREAMEEKGLLPLAGDYLQATGEFAALLYKEEIERALKTNGFDGFQLLQLQDFPGQGTALVGLLNSFWESKGVISGEDFREFNSELVPLVRFPKAAYENDEFFTGTVEVANFFKPLRDQEIVVRLKNGDTTLQEKFFDVDILGIGNGQELGEFKFGLSEVKKATKLVLEVSLPGTPYKNHWNVWVYPTDMQITEGAVVYTKSFGVAEKALQEGKKVFLNPELIKIKGNEGKFLPVFWSPVHFPNQPGTMGVLVDPTHRAFEAFPTGIHSDWHWWDLNVNAKPVQVDSLNVTTIVRMIDNFYTNRDMATVFEVRIGEGKLLFSSIDLTSDLDNRVVARQFKYSLLEYMNSEEFDPKPAMNFSEMRALLYSREESKIKEYDIYE